MGWFWDSPPNGASKDPVKSLDPSLREFLEKESPPKPDEIRTTSQSTSPSQSASSSAVPRSSYREQLGIDVSHQRSAPADASSTQNKPIVPPESLFQDGRYAHLWKNYRPQQEIDDAGKSDADRLTDIVSIYKDRKAQIGRAALENCIELQMALKECYSTGTWSQTMTMCRTENRAFNRCFDMQSRFLKALGYLSMNRTSEEEERIQMHADKLYSEMLERERMIQEAKEKGVEPPKMEPLIQPERTTEVLGADSAYARARQKAVVRGEVLNLSSFTPEKQKEIQQMLKGKSKDEQDLELQLLVAEGRASLEYLEKISAQMEEERKHRADRRERGKETVGDTIKRLWGWQT